MHSIDDPQADYHHRRHRLAGGTRLQRLGLKLSDAVEAAVVSASVYPDLPIYPNAWFPWLASLQSGWQDIRVELDAVLARRAELPNFQDILPDVGRICHDDGWKTYWLFGNGMDCAANRWACPLTSRLLQQVPDLRTAFFSVLAPGKHIPVHRGAYNGLLRLHLALKVPRPMERCRIRIGNHVRHWCEGEALVFDDSFQHEVWNDTDGERVVLFVDFARPLRQPWHRLNRQLLDLGRLAPFLREADQRQQRWSKAFHAAAQR